MANHFSQLAKKSRTNGSTEKIAKEQIGKPSLDIFKLGDDVLRQNSKRITKVDESIRKLSRQMLQSMYAAKGIGLAAPQIGINKELLVIDVNFEDSAAEPLILINPRNYRLWNTLNSYEEGCLSIPGVYLNVVRPSNYKN